MPKNETITDLGLDDYKYGFVTENEPVFKAQKGLSEEIVRQISAHKNEPEWMLNFRLKALKVYERKPMPRWGGDLSTLEQTMDEIYFYLKPQEKMERSWDDVPDEIKKTFDRLGIPEAEKKILAGVGAQYESEMVYHSLKKEWEDKGIIFDSIEDGLRKHPELFRKHFGTVVPTVVQRRSVPARSGAARSVNTNTGVPGSSTARTAARAVVTSAAPSDATSRPSVAGMSFGATSPTRSAVPPLVHTVTRVSAGSAVAAAAAARAAS